MGYAKNEKRKDILTTINKMVSSAFPAHTNTNSNSSNIPAAVSDDVEDIDPVMLRGRDSFRFSALMKMAADSSKMMDALVDMVSEDDKQHQESSVSRGDRERKLGERCSGPLPPPPTLPQAPATTRDQIGAARNSLTLNNELAPLPFRRSTLTSSSKSLSISMSDLPLFGLDNNSNRTLISASDFDCVADSAPTTVNNNAIGRRASHRFSIGRRTMELFDRPFFDTEGDTVSSPFSAGGAGATATTSEDANIEALSRQLQQ